MNTAATFTCTVCHVERKRMATARNGERCCRKCIASYETQLAAQFQAKKALEYKKRLTSNVALVKLHAEAVPGTGQCDLCREIVESGAVEMRNDYCCCSDACGNWEIPHWFDYTRLEPSRGQGMSLCHSHLAEIIHELAYRAEHRVARGVVEE